MPNERYVAAIEISSSKIIGAVGVPTPDGSLRIVAIDHEKNRQENVRRGMIQNIEATRLQLERLLDKLQHKPNISPQKIRKVFVGLSGRSMRSIETTVEKNLQGETEITTDIMEQLKRQAEDTPIDNSLDIVDAVQRRCIINGNPNNNPVGALGNSIRAVYDLITVRPEMPKNINRTLEKIPGIENAGFIVTSLATAHLILSEEERRLGCMLVDMGADTTTVTIFKDGSLCYYATIPMGSRNITLDITALKTSEDTAENIKLTSGDAMAPENPNSINIQGLKMSDVSNVVAARSHEIVANIIAQIDYASLTPDDLPSGIIVVGGGSKLRNICEVLAAESRCKVKTGKLPSFVNVLNCSNISADQYIPVASVLYSAATITDVNCLETPHVQNLPADGIPNDDDPKEDNSNEENGQQPAVRNSFNRALDRIRAKVATIFTPSDDEEDSELN